MNIKVSEKRNPGTGNPVTEISGITHNPEVIDKLASKLKSSCGAGGHVSGKTITIQGSHINKVKKILEKEGFTIN